MAHSCDHTHSQPSNSSAILKQFAEIPTYIAKKVVSINQSIEWTNKAATFLPISILVSL